MKIKWILDKKAKKFLKIFPNRQDLKREKLNEKNVLFMKIC